jgi:Xaa-Pro aminopeptidase
MREERLTRIREAMRAVDADWAVFTSPGNVLYATGHVVEVEAGPSPFAGGPTTAIVGRKGGTGLVAANVEAPRPDAADSVHSYVGYSTDASEDPAVNFRVALGQCLKKLGVGGTVAFESNSPPPLSEGLPGITRSVLLGPELPRLQAIKCADEIAWLKAAAQAAAIGQAAAREHAAVGITELDLFAHIRAAMENFAGKRVPVTGDLITGRARTARAVGWPNDRVLEPDDPIVADLAPRIAGYWGDSCGSFVLGQPSPDYLRMFGSVKRTLELAIATLRPGLKVCDFDASLRRSLEADGYACPHHMGHGIGTSVHEYPRIVSNEQAVFEKDMVVMVEPGAYPKEIGGIRLEWMLHVTARGCTPLYPFGHFATQFE